MLCVDCQNGFLGTDSVLPALAKVCGDVLNIRWLREAGRKAGVRVAHATYGGTRGAHPVGTARLWRAPVAVPRDAVGGTAGSYAQQVLDHTMAPLGRVTTVDERVARGSVDEYQPEPSHHYL